MTPQEQLRWAEAAVDAQMKALPNIRKSAESWSGTITAITGVFSAIVLLTLPKDYSKLTDDGQMWVMGLLGLALVSTILAVALAGIASQGWAAEGWYSGSAVKDITKRQAKNASRMLMISRLLMIPAVIGIAGSIYVAATQLKSADSDDTAGMSAIVLSDGSITCGTLDTTDDGVVQLQNQDKTPIAINPSVTGMSLVTECPGSESPG